MAKGNESNRRGADFENQIALALKARGFPHARQYNIGQSIYGPKYKLYTDFLVRKMPGYESGLAIECRWQAVSGTAYEKFPYMVLNIQKQFTYPAVIVIGGECNRRAYPWLVSQVGGRFVAVFWMGEFMEWVYKQSPSKIVALPELRQQLSFLGGHGC